MSLQGWKALNLVGRNDFDFRKLSKCSAPCSALAPVSLCLTEQVYQARSNMLLSYFKVLLLWSRKGGLSTPSTEAESISAPKTYLCLVGSSNIVVACTIFPNPDHSWFWLYKFVLQILASENRGDPLSGERMNKDTEKKETISYLWSLSVWSLWNWFFVFVL